MVAHRTWYFQTSLRGRPRWHSVVALPILVEADHRLALVLGEEYHRGCCSLVAMKQQGLGVFSHIRARHRISWF